MRPHLLEKSVQQYLDQTYPNKELVIVFNGRLDEIAAVQAKYRHRTDITFTAVPTDRHAGSLLNFGVRQGTGQYFFRVDDDDHYGANYVYDCILHIRSVDADVFGKQACFLHFEGEDFLYQRTRMMRRQIVQFEGKDLDISRRLFFSGCGFACKADLLKAIAYPDDNNLSADTELHNRIRTMRPNAQCLKVDDLNLVVERSADIEKHTWRYPDALLKQGSKMLEKTIDDLMV
jgi:glycosyltransferase involved in cell wall biosynthesis